MKNIQKFDKESLKQFTQLVFKTSANIQLLSESLDEISQMGYKELKLVQSIKNTQVHLHNVLARAMKIMPEDSELAHYQNVKQMEQNYVDFVNQNLTYHDIDNQNEKI